MPLTTTALMTGLTLMGTKVIEGAAKKAGEAGWQKAVEYWHKARGVLGWKTDPPADELKGRLAAAVEQDPALAARLEPIVAEYQRVTGEAIVGSINVGRGSVTIAGEIKGNVTNRNEFK